jgi:PilZ domain
VPSPASTSPSPAERRAYRRAPLEAPAMLDAASSWHAGRCQDVSAGGMAVHTEVEFDVGSIIEVYFELPSGVAIETRARVVYAGGGRLGLSFVELDSASALALRSFCRLSGIRPATRSVAPHA